jgi:excisionase family DNA binding protein
MPEHELLRLEEFAFQLRITLACARRWARERKITVVKIGRLVRVPKSEVARVIGEGTRLAKGVPRAR